LYKGKRGEKRSRKDDDGKTKVGKNRITMMGVYVNMDMKKKLENLAE